jgi:hypothetical protein
MTQLSQANVTEFVLYGTKNRNSDGTIFLAEYKRIEYVKEDAFKKNKQLTDMYGFVMN